MRRIVIIKDKALLYAIIVSMIYIPILTYIKISEVEQISKQRVGFGLGALEIIAPILVLLFFILLLSKVIQIIRFKDDHVSFSSFVTKRIEYNNIKQIKCSDKICISQKGKKDIDISVLAIAKNKDKYLEIMEILDEKSNIKINVKAEMSKLKANNRSMVSGNDSQTKTFKNG